MRSVITRTGALIISINQALNYQAFFCSFCTVYTVFNYIPTYVALVHERLIVDNHLKLNLELQQTQCEAAE